MSVYEGPSVSHTIFGWEDGGVPKMWQSRTESAYPGLVLQLLFMHFCFNTTCQFTALLNLCSFLV